MAKIVALAFIYTYINLMKNQNINRNIPHAGHASGDLGGYADPGASGASAASAVPGASAVSAVSAVSGASTTSPTSAVSAVSAVPGASGVSAVSGGSGDLGDTGDRNIPHAGHTSSVPGTPGDMGGMGDAGALGDMGDMGSRNVSAAPADTGAPGASPTSAVSAVSAVPAVPGASGVSAVSADMGDTPAPTNAGDLVAPHSPDINALISRYKLMPHPEGGFYAETYRSFGAIPAESLPSFSGSRAYSTAIVYLLRAGDKSHLHRIKQDEMWHFYLGGPMRLVMLTPKGEFLEIILGQNFAKGQLVQYCVPRGCWFGASPLPQSPFSFVGCTVAPGFEFEDFELASKHQLSQQFPAFTHVINEFTIS